MQSLKIKDSDPVNQYWVHHLGESAYRAFRNRRITQTNMIARHEIYRTRQHQFHEVSRLGTGHPQYKSIRDKYMSSSERLKAYGWNGRAQVQARVLQLSALSAAECFLKSMRLASKGHTARLSIGEGRFEVTTRLMKNGKLRTRYRSNYWSGSHRVDDMDSQCEDLFMMGIMSAIEEFRHEYLKGDKK